MINVYRNTTNTSFLIPRFSVIHLYLEFSLEIHLQIKGASPNRNHHSDDYSPEKRRRRRKKMQNPNIILYAPHTAKLEDKPIPTLSSPHDVVIRINYIGVCGSDVCPPPLPFHQKHSPSNTQLQGPLLAPRLPRKPHKPLYRYNNGPRSLGHNPRRRV